MYDMQAHNAEGMEAEASEKNKSILLRLDDDMTDSDLWKMLAVVFILVMLFVHFVIGDIPEGYEDEDGFHYGRKENK